MKSQEIQHAENQRDQFLSHAAALDQRFREGIAAGIAIGVGVMAALGVILRHIF